MSRIFTILGALLVLSAVCALLSLRKKPFGEKKCGCENGVCKRSGDGERHQSAR